MNSRLITLSAAMLMLASGAYAAEKQANDTGWDMPGYHDADTDMAYVGSGQRVAFSEPRPLQSHRMMLSARDSNDGMAAMQHVGSPSDDPHSGTASGISKETSNPATSRDRMTRADR